MRMPLKLWTQRFIRYLKNYYQTNSNISIEDSFLNAWIFTEGLPADCPQPVSTRFEKVDAFSQQWKNSGKLILNRQRTGVLTNGCIS